MTLPRSQGTNVMLPQLLSTSSAKARALCHGLLLKALIPSNKLEQLTFPRKWMNVSPYVVPTCTACMWGRNTRYFEVPDVPGWWWCCWRNSRCNTRNSLCFSCALLLYPGWLWIIKPFLLLDGFQEKLFRDVFKPIQADKSLSKCTNICLYISGNHFLTSETNIAWTSSPNLLIQTHYVFLDLLRLFCAWHVTHHA